MGAAGLVGVGHGRARGPTSHADGRTVEPWAVARGLRHVDNYDGRYDDPLGYANGAIVHSDGARTRPRSGQGPNGRLHSGLLRRMDCLQRGCDIRTGFIARCSDDLADDDEHEPLSERGNPYRDGPLSMDATQIGLSPSVPDATWLSHDTVA